uniref:Hamartin-like n=1 Tax=Steinernema glaseri TaxID=37863 RepID=A0A1I7Y627_9BILA
MMCHGGHREADLVDGVAGLVDVGRCLLRAPQPLAERYSPSIALLSVVSGQGIGKLVDYYCRNQSIRALELLCIVQEPHEKILLDKIKDAICNKKAVLSTIILLGQIIQKEPNWLPKVPNHGAFSTFLRHINDCRDPREIIAGLLLLSSLLPFCSRITGNNLTEVFTTFLSCLCFLRERRQLVQRRTVIPDRADKEIEKIYLSHLQYSVVQLFIILYGMFPCNMMTYLRRIIHGGTESQRKALEMHVSPLFSLVRLHPSLVYLTKEKELGKERWVQREPHDFFADCRRLTIGFAGKVDVRDGTLRVKEFDTCSQSTSNSGSTLRNLNYGIVLPTNFHAEGGGIADDWDPNDMDLDTPSDERSLSPTLQGRSSSTLIPNWERSSTSGRRQSFGQRMTGFLRSITHRSHSQDGISDDGTSSTMRRDYSGVSMDGGLADIMDEDEDFGLQAEHLIEVASGHSEEASGEFQLSSLEEGVDAAAECSPIVHRRSLTPKVSTEEEPTVIPEGRSRSPSFIFGKVNTSSTSIQDAPPETADNSAAAMFLSTPRASRANTDDEELLDDDEENDDDPQMGPFSLPKESGATETVVQKMLFKINRKRFCSECPQSTISPESLFLRDCAKHNFKEEDVLSNATSTSTAFHNLKRSQSLPNLTSKQRKRVRIHPDAQVISGNESDEDDSSPQPATEAKMRASGLDYLSQHKLVGLVPYLPLLRKCDSDVGIEDLILEFEGYRERYMDASARHHNCLRELGLADKAPGRIYDDMSRLLEGMDLEKKCEVLQTRLILVNQHLMYERCGRLIHGVRNRRLFGRLKQQKSLEAEILMLKKSRHTGTEHNNRLVGLLTDLRKEISNTRKREADKYRDLERLYGECQRQRHSLESELAQIKKQRNADKEIIEQLREELDMSRRCHNDAEARLLFAKRQVEDFDSMKSELQYSQRKIQKLRDGMAAGEMESSKSGQSARDLEASQNEEMLTAAENEIRQLRETNRRLKIECERTRQMAQISDDRARDEAIKANDLRIEHEKKCRVHKDQYDAAKQKFASLRVVLTKQESHILELYNEIEKLSDKPYRVNQPLAIPKREMPSETGSLDNSFCGSESGTSNGFRNELFTRGDGIRREFSAQDFRYRTKTNTL